MRSLPSHPLLHRRAGLSLIGWVAATAVLATGGCAKFPANGGAYNTHLIVRMTVDGHIKNGPGEQTQYVYIVAFNPSVDLYPTGPGPEPVIAPPWGNGFVAGGVTHFVRYDSQQFAPYVVYKFTSQDLLAWGATGVPVNSLDPNQGPTIQFEIDLSQITPDGLTPDQLQSVQVNFLTMDRVPQGNDTGTKFWDALGDGHDPNSINDYVRIPLNVSATYDNAYFQDLEPSGDTPDPDLDIVNWSVEVRKP